MKTPVLIPARNEERSIGRLLSHLPSDVDPIVITNGPDDGTALVAEQYGAQVIASPIEGKVPALQHGLRQLGSRALEPLLLIDADSCPVSKRWARTMLKQQGSHNKQPLLMGGLVLFSEGTDVVSGLVHSFKPVLEAWTKGESHIRGANTMLRIAHSGLLDSILDMPNFWPGEEGALVDMIDEAGGVIHQVLSPLAAVLTDGSRLSSLRTRFQHGGGYTHQLFVDSYSQDAPPNAISYWQLDTKLSPD